MKEEAFVNLADAFFVPNPALILKNQQDPDYIVNLELSKPEKIMRLIRSNG